MSEKQYTSDDISVLSDREHLRLRISMYAGNTNTTSYMMPNFTDNKFDITKVEFVPAALKCINEIRDNSSDELMQIDRPNKRIDITADVARSTYTIADNGRGVPIDVHRDTGLPTPQTVFGSLRSGRNFGDEKTAGVIGMNGIGSSMTNYVSDFFRIRINRDNKQYTQEFTEGALNVTQPLIKSKKSKETGTSITFKLDDSVFSNTIIPEVVMHNNAIEVAFNNPGVLVAYNGTEYKFKNGLTDVIKSISTQSFSFSNDAMNFNVIFDLCEEQDEQVFVYCNGSYLWEGGCANTQFTAAFFDKVIDHLSRAAKAQKCEVTKADIRGGLLIIGSLKLTNPNFDSQAKTRLTGPYLRKDFDALLERQWKVFAKQHKEWLDGILARAFDRHHSEANAKAQKNMAKKVPKKVPGLIDASEKDRSKCTLYLCEGDSAKFSLANIRTSSMAIYPLTGKINNTYGCTIAQIADMGKVAKLLNIIGLVPGKPAVRSQLRYGNGIYLVADADVDGSDITTLMINIFYNWPELFDPKLPPFVYKMIVPNICCVKGNKRVHFATKAQYQAVSDKYKGWEVTYLKGLGTMIPADWDLIASNIDQFLIPLVDDGSLAAGLKLAFSDDVDARKKWLGIDG